VLTFSVSPQVNVEHQSKRGDRTEQASFGSNSFRILATLAGEHEDGGAGVLRPQPIQSRRDGRTHASPWLEIVSPRILSSLRARWIYLFINPPLKRWATIIMSLRDGLRMSDDLNFTHHRSARSGGGSLRSFVPPQIRWRVWQVDWRMMLVTVA
jgi:hypothetical protein